MGSQLFDPEDLRSISPVSLTAYARSLGWTQAGPYGKTSDVYVHPKHHDLILPRKSRIRDYARVVAGTIEDLAEIEESDALAVYRRLQSADRDEIRVRGVPARAGDETTIRDAATLIGGSRAIILAAACQAERARAVLRPEANKEAVSFADRITLEHTAPGSFVLVFRTTRVVPVQQPGFSDDFGKPQERGDRKFTTLIPRALAAAGAAVESAVRGESDGFSEVVEEGVSANLCETLADLLDPFPLLEFTVGWALTAPRDVPSESAAFDQSAIPILRDAAAAFREREPREGATLVGMIERLDRPADDDDGMINLRTFVDGRAVTVRAQLKQVDYERAIRSHGDRVPISLEGDLERIGQRWRLLGAELVAVHGGD